jgi:hypothetical protein
MNEIMLIIGVIVGAGIYHLASQRNVVETQPQPKKQYVSMPIVEAEAMAEQTIPPDIEKALAELRPPNIFERRQEREAIEKEQERVRRMALPV